MTREEAIAFLQEIKMNLEFLQTRYSQLQHSKEEQQRAKVRDVQQRRSCNNLVHQVQCLSAF
jgi:prefoldin subunit 5